MMELLNTGVPSVRDAWDDVLPSQVCMTSCAYIVLLW